MSFNETQTHRACIAIGSNLGARESNIQKALGFLEKHPEISLNARSRLIETDAVGGAPDQPKYLNGTALLCTTLSPRALLETLLSVEGSLGRDRSTAERNAPRTMDLDLLLYDDLVLNQKDLVVPHPRMHERDFVLLPLAEIAPDFVHPKLNMTIAELAKRFSSGIG